MKILFEISYLGSAYHGFQVQKTLPTVQKTLQKALEEIYKVPLLIKGCNPFRLGPILMKSFKFIYQW